jgi:hypothetical protein
MSPGLLLIVAAAVITTATPQARGATVVPHNYVTYDFAGVIGGVSTADVGPDDPPFPDLFHAGDLFYGSFTVDTLIGPRGAQPQAAYNNVISLDGHFSNSGGEYYSFLISGGPAPETQIDFHPNLNNVDDRFAVVGRESDGFLTAADVGDYFLSGFFFRFDAANNDLFPGSPDYPFPDVIDTSKFTASSFGVSFLARTIAVDPDVSGVFTSLELRQDPLSTVPEPGSLALLGCGAAGIAAFVRRRQAA